MTKEWNEPELQRYIDDEIEENSSLEYKAADALERTDGKRKEITKDVSAMANADGGIIIYGIKEYDAVDKKHLPETITPIDRIQFSKEWLEQVINNIRPRITGIVIYPVSLASGPNHTAYVVEIPQSNTAHQALDFRYYRRFNFQLLPMEDYTIRDVMNRATVPDADAEFRCRLTATIGTNREYILLPIVKNLGAQVIKNFRLIFIFPKVGQGRSTVHPRENVVITINENNDHFISYQSRGVLFPLEERNIGDEINWKYNHSPDSLKQLRDFEMRNQEVFITWTLYADNMIPKQGKVPVRNLNDFQSVDNPKDS